MNNNPVRYNDPSGHDVGCAGRDASECGTNQQPTSSPPYRPTQTPGMSLTPWNSQTWNTPTPPGPSYSPGPTPPPTPETTIGQSPDGFNIIPKVNITVNWEKVDKVDFWIDVAGLAGNISKNITIGRVPVGLAVYVVSEGAQGVGLGKAIVDVFNKKPQNMALALIEKTAIYGGKLSPSYGWAFNLVSLGINILPNTTIGISWK
jgi:hypothetical protein